MIVGVASPGVGAAVAVNDVGVGVGVVDSQVEHEESVVRCVEVGDDSAAGVGHAVDVPSIGLTSGDVVVDNLES